MGDDASILEVNGTPAVQVGDAVAVANGYRDSANTIESRRVLDDWPDAVPVSGKEVDVIETWFASLLDEALSNARR